MMRLVRVVHREPSGLELMEKPASAEYLVTSFEFWDKYLQRRARSND